MNNKTERKPDQIQTYFLTEKVPLLIVTISGLIYNIGLVTVPWFEGKLAQCLLDIFRKQNTFYDMLWLALIYAVVVAVVQIARYVKRFYVRRFANDVNRQMKQVLYGNLVHSEKVQLEQENVGSVMTKAISDVEACAEGMRKFTTEVFDTGVAMIGYIAFLLWHDWRLSLLCMIFPPISYFLAEHMKKVVQQANAVYKESSGRLSAATLDRVQGALTYRVTGSEARRNADYEMFLADYEKKAVRANVWVSSLQPLYKVISMVSVLFIFYFGAKNVLHTGWTTWDIAAFTAFLSCFARLAVKSSKAAKLFNAVQKAQVSWKRIKPLMREVPSDNEMPKQKMSFLQAQNLGFAYPGGPNIFGGLNFEAHMGEIIGVTGPVACGKSTLGKTFLCEYSYQGSICVDGVELGSMNREIQRCLVGYLGHDPEILSTSIRENITMGDAEVDAEYWLRMVCLDKEVSEMQDGIDTQVGSGGIRLSGGQSQRLGLARILAHDRPILILDDPFSALDQETEKIIFAHLKKLSQDRIVLIFSHRLYLFPQMDQVIWMENGDCQVSDHATLLKTQNTYAQMFHAQVKEGETDAR